MIDNFIEELNAEIYGIVRNATLGFSQNGRMVLGGSTGPDGGSGVPPGGFIGQLTQGNVTYDTTEAIASGGASSLVDNLNHIRYDVAENAADIATISGAIASGVVTDFISLSDTPESYVGHGGAILAVSDEEDSIVFSGAIGNLNYNKINLNSSVNEDFTFSKELDINEDAPDLIIEVPVTNIDRGKIIFRDGPDNTPPAQDLTVDAYGYKEIPTGTGTLSFTVDNNPYRTLVVGVALRGGVSVSSVTFNSVAFTKAGHAQPGSDVRSEIWYLEDPDVGTYDIEVTCSSSQSIVFGATSFYNVESIGAYSSDTGSGSSATNAVGSTTTSVVDALALQSDNGGIEVTSGNTEQTELIAHSYPSATLGMSIIDGSATSDSKWTFNGDWYALSFLILNEISVISDVGEVILELEGTTATFKGDINVALEANIVGDATFGNDITLSSGTLNVQNKILDTGNITDSFTISGGILDSDTSVGAFIIGAKGSPTDAGKIIFQQGTIASATLLAPPQIDSSTYELQTTDASHSYPLTVGDNSNRGLLVYITRKSGAPGVTVITYNSEALALIESNAFGSNGYIEAYYLASPDVGTYNLEITRDNSVAVDISVISIYDINSYDIAEYATYSSSPSIDVTEDCLVISCLSLYTSNTIVTGDNQTEIYNGTYSAVSYANAPEDMNYTLSGSEQLGHIVFKFFGVLYTDDRYIAAEFDEVGTLVINKGILISGGSFTSPAENLVITTSGEVNNLNANYLQGYTALELLGGTDVNAIHVNVSGEINVISEKTNIVDADIIVIEDSEDSFEKKKATFSSVETLLDTKYPTRGEWDQNGFATRTTSTITWTDSSPDYTLSIQPTSTDFNYWVVGVKYTTTGDTVQIDNTEGIHIIYYDGSVLTALANPSSGNIDTIIRTKCLVSIIYWDTSEASALYVGEERHGYGMAPDTHSYLHFTKGLAYLSGLGLTNLSVDEDGSSNTHAQFGIDSGGVSDEDLYKAISTVTSTTGLPIYYMTGAIASPGWNKYINAGFSVRTQDGTTATRLAYNGIDGGNWELTEEANGNFVLYHIFASTEKDNPMICIMGQNGYATRVAARSGADTEIRSLVLDDVLFPEIHPIATIIYQTKLSYTNDVNARTVSTADGDDYIDWRSTVIERVAISTSDHGSLTGLGDDDHPQYLLADGTRALTGPWVPGQSTTFSGGSFIMTTSEEINNLNTNYFQGYIATNLPIDGGSF